MKKPLIALAAASLLTACATQPGSTQEQTDRNNTAIGAVIGAVAGAVVGGQMDDDGNRDRGTIIGAVTGAMAGAGVGNYMDRQEEEMRAALRAEQQRSDIEIQRVREDLLQLTFDSEVTFDVNSAAVKPAFQNSLNKVSDVLVKYQSLAEVVGHTDSTGSAAYNQQLSEQRAASVRNYLVNMGVPSGSILASGQGETNPRASNDTEAGRQLNRRVDVFIRPGPNVAR